MGTFLQHQMGVGCVWCQFEVVELDQTVMHSVRKRSRKWTGRIFGLTDNLVLLGGRPYVRKKTGSGW